MAPAKAILAARLCHRDPIVSISPLCLSGNQLTLKLAYNRCMGVTAYSSSQQISYSNQAPKKKKKNTVMHQLTTGYILVSALLDDFVV